MERDEIKNVFRQYVMFSRQLPEYEQAVRDLIKAEPKAIDFVISELSNDQFWRVVRNLHLPNEVIQKRLQCDIDILKDSKNHSLGSVQYALSDLWFRMNPDSFRQRLKTLAERAKFSQEYKKIYEEYQAYYEKIEAFLKLKEGEVTEQQIASMIDDLVAESKKFTEDKTNSEIFDAVCEQAESGFRSELDSMLKSSQETMFNGIEPEVIKSSSGKEVKVFKMQNQTENQRHFEILARSVSNYDMQDEESRKRYFEKIKSYPYMSYSLFTETLNRQFLKNGVMFGYSSTGEAEMLSCTVRDGQTNQTYLDTGRYILRQNYLPVDEFVRQTDEYNELVLRNSQQLSPSMIICLTYPPNDVSIELAEKFNVPIVFIDREAYSQREQVSAPMEWYENKPYLDTPLKLAKAKEHSEGTSKDGAS